MAGERVLHTPAGSCPVKLEGTSLEEVRDWSNLVVQHGKQNNLVYLPSALIYFSQQFYSIFTPEYKEVKSHIEEIFSVNKNLENLFVEEQRSNIEKQKEEKLMEKKLKEEKASEQINNLPNLETGNLTPVEQEVTIKRKRGRPPKNK